MQNFDVFKNAIKLLMVGNVITTHVKYFSKKNVNTNDFVFCRIKNIK